MIYIRWYIKKCCKLKSCGYFFSTLAIQVASTSSTSKLCGAAGLGFAHIGRVKAWWWIIAWRRPGNSSGFTTHLGFHHWFKVKIFFHTKNFLKMCSSTSLLQLSCFRSLSQNGICFLRDFQGFSAKNSPVHPTNPRLLSKMTLLQSSQAGWNPRSTLLRVRLHVSELSHNMNIATLDKQSFRN